MADFVVVIPARMASARLPGKPLLDIAGKPMIAWVHARALKSAAQRVIVATDDERIRTVCGAIGAHVEMTSDDHASGTDRIAEVAQRLQWSDDSIVVNVQGDEPLIEPAAINQVAKLLVDDPGADLGTLMTPITNEREFRDQNNAKVVTDGNGRALYFSRAPIPASRDGDLPLVARRHIGLYAYRVKSLKVIAAAAVCPLEAAERLEQLRALWLGLTIAVADADLLPSQGIDTEQDLDWVRSFVADGGIEL